MKERPLLMTGPLVRKSLADEKTQTRRPVKSLRVRLRHEVSSDLPAIIRPVVRYGPGVYPAGMNQHGAVHVAGDQGDLGVKPGEFDFVCPYAEGHTYLRKHPDGRQVWHLQVLEEQRLWVRETHQFLEMRDGNTICAYRASCEDDALTYASPRLSTVEAIKVPRWRPSLFMPRDACRLVLDVTDVRVERLQAISDEDVRAEGVADRAAFAAKWDEIYGDGEWERSPFVWAITFRRVTT